MQINTTSEEISNWSQDIEKRLRKEPGFEHALETDFDTQRNTETAWLKHKKIKASLCPLTKAMLNELQEKSLIPGLVDAARLTNLSKKGNYYDSKQLLDVFCGFASGIVSANELFSLSARSSFKSLFNLSRNDSLWGGEKEKEIVMIKTTPFRDCNASECDILHEAVVTIFGTNSLRSLIPNFPYVYALGFGCSPPTSSQQITNVSSPRRKRGTTNNAGASAGSETSASWCHLDTTLNTSPFLIMENFASPSSLTLKDAIGNGTVTKMSDFYALIMQISHALKYAYEKISFTHYDLTPETIILRPLGCSSSKKAAAESGSTTHQLIPYEEGGIFIQSKYVAVFTEFGFSHVSVQNSEKRLVSFGFASKGRSSMVTYGIFRDRANPICDIYRLLILCMIEAKEIGNEALADGIFKIFKYFNQTETMDEIISRQASTGYYLPLTTRTRGYSFEEFISFTKKEAKTSKWENCIFSAPFSQSLVSSSPLLLGAGAGITSPFSQRIHLPTTPIFLSGSGSGSGSGGSKDSSSLQQLHLPSSVQTIFGASFNVPETFLGFYDIYSLLIVKISTPEDADSARSFTKAFINRFSEGVSCFNKSLTHAKRFATETYNHFLKTLSSPETTFKYTPFPPSKMLPLLFIGKPETEKLEEDLFFTLNRCSSLFDFYDSVYEMNRVFNYCVSLYWKDQTDLPDEIIDLRDRFETIISAMSEPLILIHNLLENDVKEISKNTKETKAFKERALNASSNSKAKILMETYETLFAKAEQSLGLKE